MTDDPGRPTNDSTHPSRRLLRPAGRALIVLVTGTLLSLWAWRAETLDAVQRADAEFERYALTAHSRLDARIHHSLDVLSGFRALFANGAPVRRADFRQHFETMRIEERFPSIRAVQFARLVEDRDRAAFEARVRADDSLVPGGYPDFRIRPEGRRARYVAVEFNEPMSGNESAFGYDTYEEATRREVLQRARDTGRAAASAPIGLLQGRTGVVVRIPVYRHGAPIDSVAQRQSAFIGLVSGVIGVQDLLDEALPAQTRQSYRVTIEDLGPVTPSSIAAVPGTAQVARTAGNADVLPEPAAEDVKVQVMDVGGRRWAVEVARAPVRPALTTGPLTAIASGLAITCLLAGLVWRTSFRYAETRRLAQRLSADARANAARLEAVFQCAVDGIVTIDARGTILSVNRAAQRIFAIDESGLVGSNVSMLMPHGQAMRHDAYLRAHVEGRGQSTIGTTRRLQALRADGTEFPIELSISEMDFDGERQFVGLIRDLSETVAAQEAIERSRRELQTANSVRAAVFEHSALALVVTDPIGLIRAVNPAAERLLGRPAVDMVGVAEIGRFCDRDELRELATLLSERLGRPVEPGVDYFVRSLDSDDSMHCELHLLRPDGVRMPVALTVSAIRDDAGAITGFVSSAQDNTERKRLADEMMHLAYHDGLTGLPNRVLLEDRLGQAIRTNMRQGLPLSLLFIDLDRFKPINDTWGHAAGDQVLCEVARRLKSALRASDTVARIGGDEFVVLLTTLKRADDAAVVADKLIDALSQPILVGGHDLQVGASIGVVHCPDDGVEPQVLLRRADAAMYAAKESGRRAVNAQGVTDAG